jgi:hypothetical protein
MANVTSVTSGWFRPYWRIAACVAGIGVFLLIGALFAHIPAGVRIFYLLLVVLCYFIARWLWLIQRHGVVLRTAGGERRVFEDGSKEHIRKITQAINEAIVARG